MMIAIAFAIGQLARQGPMLWRRAQLLYWQRQCNRYEFPPGQLIFDSEASGGVVAPPWQAFYKRLSPPGMQSKGTIFLHALVSPAGHHRLVAVDLLPGTPSSVTINAKVIIPGNFNSEPKESLRGYPGTDLSYIAPVRIFSEAMDTMDHSHFTIQAQEALGPVRLEGWLRDNDDVVFEFHPIPAIQPVPGSPASSR